MRPALLLLVGIVCFTNSHAAPKDIKNPLVETLLKQKYPNLDEDTLQSIVGKLSSQDKVGTGTGNGSKHYKITLRRKNNVLDGELEGTTEEGLNKNQTDSDGNHKVEHYGNDINFHRVETLKTPSSDNRTLTTLTTTTNQTYDKDNNKITKVIQRNKQTKYSLGSSNSDGNEGVTGFKAKTVLLSPEDISGKQSFRTLITKYSITKNKGTSTEKKPSTEDIKELLSIVKETKDEDASKNKKYFQSFEIVKKSSKEKKTPLIKEAAKTFLDNKVFSKSSLKTNSSSYSSITVAILKYISQVVEEFPQFREEELIEIFLTYLPEIINYFEEKLSDDTAYEFLEYIRFIFKKTTARPEGRRLIFLKNAVPKLTEQLPNEKITKWILFIVRYLELKFVEESDDYESSSDTLSQDIQQIITQYDDGQASSHEKLTVKDDKKENNDKIETKDPIKTKNHRYTVGEENIKLKKYERSNEEAAEHNESNDLGKNKQTLIENKLPAKRRYDEENKLKESNEKESESIEIEQNIEPEYSIKKKTKPTVIEEELPTRRSKYENENEESNYKEVASLENIPLRNQANVKKVIKNKSKRIKSNRVQDSLDEALEKIKRKIKDSIEDTSYELKDDQEKKKQKSEETNAEIKIKTTEVQIPSSDEYLGDETTEKSKSNTEADKSLNKKKSGINQTIKTIIENGEQNLENKLKSKVHIPHILNEPDKELIIHEETTVIPQDLPNIHENEIYVTESTDKDAEPKETNEKEETIEITDESKDTVTEEPQIVHVVTENSIINENKSVESEIIEHVKEEEHREKQIDSKTKKNTNVNTLYDGLIESGEELNNKDIELLNKKVDETTKKEQELLEIVTDKNKWIEIENNIEEERAIEVPEITKNKEKAISEKEIDEPVIEDIEEGLYKTEELKVDDGENKPIKGEKNYNKELEEIKNLNDNFPEDVVQKIEEVNTKEHKENIKDASDTDKIDLSSQSGLNDSKENEKIKEEIIETKFQTEETSTLHPKWKESIVTAEEDEHNILENNNTSEKYLTSIEDKEETQITDVKKSSEVSSSDKLAQSSSEKGLAEEIIEEEVVEIEHDTEESSTLHPEQRLDESVTVHEKTDIKSNENKSKDGLLRIRNIQNVSNTAEQNVTPDNNNTSEKYLTSIEDKEETQITNVKKSSEVSSSDKLVQSSSEKGLAEEIIEEEVVEIEHESEESSTLHPEQRLDESVTVHEKTDIKSNDNKSKDGLLRIRNIQNVSNTAEQNLTPDHNNTSEKYLTSIEDKEETQITNVKKSSEVSSSEKLAQSSSKKGLAEEIIEEEVFEIEHESEESSTLHPEQRLDESVTVHEKTDIKSNDNKSKDGLLRIRNIQNVSNTAEQNVTPDHNNTSEKYLTSIEDKEETHITDVKKSSEVSSSDKLAQSSSEKGLAEEIIEEEVFEIEHESEESSTLHPEQRLDESVTVHEKTDIKSNNNKSKDGLLRIRNIQNVSYTAEQNVTPDNTITSLGDHTEYTESTFEKGLNSPQEKYVEEETIEIEHESEELSAQQPIQNFEEFINIEDEPPESETQIQPNRNNKAEHFVNYLFTTKRPIQKHATELLENIDNSISKELVQKAEVLKVENQIKSKSKEAVTDSEDKGKEKSKREEEIAINTTAVNKNYNLEQVTEILMYSKDDTKTSTPKSVKSVVTDITDSGITTELSTAWDLIKEAHSTLGFGETRREFTSALESDEEGSVDVPESFTHIYDHTVVNEDYYRTNHESNIEGTTVLNSESLNKFNDDDFDKFVDRLVAEIKKYKVEHSNAGKTKQSFVTEPWIELSTDQNIVETEIPVLLQEIEISEDKDKPTESELKTELLIATEPTERYVNKTGKSDILYKLSAEINDEGLNLENQTENKEEKINVNPIKKLEEVVTYKPFKDDTTVLPLELTSSKEIENHEEGDENFKSNEIIETLNVNHEDNVQHNLTEDKLAEISEIPVLLVKGEDESINAILTNVDKIKVPPRIRIEDKRPLDLKNTRRDEDGNENIEGTDAEDNDRLDAKPAPNKQNGVGCKGVKQSIQKSAFIKIDKIDINLNTGTNKVAQNLEHNYKSSKEQRDEEPTFNNFNLYSVFSKLFPSLNEYFNSIQKDNKSETPKNKDTQGITTYELKPSDASKAEEKLNPGKKHLSHYKHKIAGESVLGNTFEPKELEGEISDSKYSIESNWSNDDVNNVLYINEEDKNYNNVKPVDYNNLKAEEQLKVIPFVTNKSGIVRLKVLKHENLKDKNDKGEENSKATPVISHDLANDYYKQPHQLQKPEEVVPVNEDNAIITYYPAISHHPKVNPNDNSVPLTHNKTSRKRHCVCEDEN